MFISYIAFLILRAKKSNANGLKEPAVAEEQEQTDGKKKKKKKPLWLSIILTIIGAAGIIFGGPLTVNSAQAIALKLGMSETLVGLTIVAVGTSLPELVTSVVAAIKKENDIAIGNVVGSNIFNVIFILGISATINPLIIADGVAFGTLIDMLVMLGSGIITMIIAFCSKKMRRWQGIIMFLLYVGYMAYIIIRN